MHHPAKAPASAATKNLPKELGDKAIASLSLPPTEYLADADEKTLIAYRHLAQVLDRLKSSKPINEYLERALAKHVSHLDAMWGNLPNELPTRENVRTWIQALKGCEAVQTAAQALTEKFEAKDAPVLLRYLHALAKASDLSSVQRLKSDACVITPLYKAMQRAPDINQIKDLDNPCLLVIDETKSRKILLIANAAVVSTGKSAHGQNQEQLGLVPVSNANLRMHIPSYLDDEGVALADMDLEAAAEVLAKSFHEDALANWQTFMTAVSERCQQAFDCGLSDLNCKLNGQSARDLSLLVCDAAALSGWLAKAYDDIVQGKRDTTLLTSILSDESEQTMCRLSKARRDLFLGHMDERADKDKPSDNAPRISFPLDATQRLAAMTALSMTERGGTQITPVNGPPGTGKTSFLKAVLASTWVRAALEQRDSPPLVVGTGFTNNAVSNIINAFSSVDDLPPTNDDWSITHRWLSGLPSYGWLYPSIAAREKYPAMMHLVKNEFGQDFMPNGGAIGFSESDIQGLEQTYIWRAQISLQQPRLDSVVAITESLHKCIAHGVKTMRLQQLDMHSNMARLHTACLQAKGMSTQLRLNTELTHQIEPRITQLAIDEAWHRDCIETLAAHAKSYALCHTGWRQIFPQPIRTWLLKQHLAVEAELATSATNLLQACGMDFPKLMHDRDKLLSHLSLALTSMLEELSQLRQGLARAQGNISSAHAALQERRSAFDALRKLLDQPKQTPKHERSTLFYMVKAVMQPSIDAQALEILWQRFDAKQDLDWRFKLFHLAARYWEGRWLIAAATLPEANAGTFCTFNAAGENLKRMMCLGVIVVSTMHKIPTLCANNQIDLLVIDEAGQCAPELGGMAFSYAKSALVVGDEKQLQPIASVSNNECNQIARRLDINPSLVPRSVHGVTGSALAMARRATPVTDGVDGSGITLLYHYRCHPTIIEYCNRLLYKRKIRPVRPNTPTKVGFDPMTWVDVPNAKPSQVGTSWVNEAEIASIARWIIENHAHLTSTYDKPLSEVLAVITPLRAQADRIKEYLPKALARCIDKDVLAGMTFGTVHALQGAERPVVIFSLVQHRTDGRLFADNDDGQLMNVAVSRAKDAFIVFGHRASLSPAPNDAPLRTNAQSTPTGQLGKYLKEAGTRLFPRRLVVVEAPGKVNAIQQALGTLCKVIATAGHFRESSLDANGLLQWSAPPENIVNEFKLHTGLLDDVVIATDDDLAGELIGMHVGELAHNHLALNLPVKRMRFNNLDATHLQDSLKAAGPNFDADLLGAALLRETLRHADVQSFAHHTNNAMSYTPANQRAIVDLVDTMTQAPGAHVLATVRDDQTGQDFTAFVATSAGGLAAAEIFETEAANARARALQGQHLYAEHITQLNQITALYPPTTTFRALSVAADELGILPWDTQDHLNAMYQQGAAKHD